MPDDPSPNTIGMGSKSCCYGALGDDISSVGTWIFRRFLLLRKFASCLPEVRVSGVSSRSAILFFLTGAA